jgi:hypothetical protein
MVRRIFPHDSCERSELSGRSGKARRQAGVSHSGVACDTSMPSFCNSPWMRGAPQSGFASRIRRIRTLRSDASAGRPMRRDREFHRQYAANARRCQRTTVAGVTICTACRQFGQTIERSTQSRRSSERRRGRVGAARCDTASGCRSRRISAASSSRERIVTRSEASRATNSVLSCPRTVSVSGPQPQRPQYVPNIQ